jgi:hypothetical protein
MPVCHYPTKHVGKLRSAICLRGHFIPACLDSACRDIATASQPLGRKSPVALWHQPVRQTIPAEHSKTPPAQC